MEQEEAQLSDAEKALKASILYSDDKTFQDVADELGTSKSYAQELVRRGIDLLLEKGVKVDNPQNVINNPVSVEQSQGLIPQLLRPEAFILETQGIPRRVTLTPKDLMIFDLWCGQGFTGDLSDFISDCIQFLYETSRPKERMFNLR